MDRCDVPVVARNNSASLLEMTEYLRHMPPLPRAYEGSVNQ